MAVMASRLASGTRQKLKKTAAEPSEKDLLEEEMAVAAVGAKHTEQQLLRASRLGLMAFWAHQDCSVSCRTSWCFFESAVPICCNSLQ